VTYLCPQAFTPSLEFSTASGTFECDLIVHDLILFFASLGEGRET